VKPIFGGSLEVIFSIGVSTALAGASTGSSITGSTVTIPTAAVSSMTRSSTGARLTGAGETVVFSTTGRLCTSAKMATRHSDRMAMNRMTSVCSSASAPASIADPRPIA
jgi:hypothetical protein